MRKRIITPDIQTTTPHSDQGWLNLEELVEVEITSENANYPIESALLSEKSSGWLAAKSGEQTIRLIFSAPQLLQRIWLNFEEKETERTQEYTLRCSSDNGNNFQEIVRQQWNFSPTGSINEIEDHHINLPAVTILELSIVPDIKGGEAFASLAQLKLA